MRPTERIRLAFLAEAGPARDALDAWSGLEAAVRELVDNARAAWPQLAIEVSVFVRHAARSVANDPAPIRALKELHAGDLYLACACAAGDPAAIEAFDKQLLSGVAAYIARTDSHPAVADEVRQLLRHRLLVAEGDVAPKIASYSGRGPLGGWLRTVAVRTALELVRARKPHTELDEASGGIALRAAQHDPELEYLKARYATEVGDAFAAILGALPRKQRNILRLYFLEGMTIEAIAPLYRVHRMTISRWIQTWRKEIFSATQKLLRERLKVSPEELDSLLRFVQSRIEVSIRRFLA